MAHGDTREGKWRGNWQMEWVASTLHTTLEHGVSSITTADAHTSAASRRLKWRPRLFKWTCPFHRKTKSGSCTCAITFLMQSTFREALCTFLIISHQTPLRMRNVSDKSRRETQNTHFVFSNFFLQKSCHLWDIVENMVEPDRPHTTIRRVCFACWITKASSTHSEYVILTAFPQQ